MTEIQITKTISFEHLNIRILILFRASDFGFRAFHYFVLRILTEKPDFRY